MVSPWTLRLAVASVDRTGEAAGRLYAISTAGSLVGTLASALVLIPAVGTRRTFLTFAILLAAVAAVGMLPARRWLLVPAALAALLALPPTTIKASGPGRVVFETETAYQYARVVQMPNGERRLELNEGHATHSLYHPRTVLTGDYWDAMLEDSKAGGRVPRSVAILGNAAGTTARAFHRLYPQTRLDPVEIDPELTAIGRRWFGLPRSVHVHHEDARAFLRRRPNARWDAILVDVYRQPYIPFYLVTKEFAELVRDRLAPRGVVVVNVGHPLRSSKLERVLTATMRSVFPRVRRDPVRPTNTQLLAGRTSLRGTRLRPPLGGAELYTDDRAPVEWLIDRSLVEYAAKP
jgi:spermidine synthase